MIINMIMLGIAAGVFVLMVLWSWGVLDLFADLEKALRERRAERSVAKALQEAADEKDTPR